MTLGRLGQREGAALAQRVVKGKALPTEVLNAIIDHADGVHVMPDAQRFCGNKVLDDVAAFVADTALAAPRNGTIEIAGPDRAPFDEVIRNYLRIMGDDRPFHADSEAHYFGGKVERFSLVPHGRGTAWPNQACRSGQTKARDVSQLRYVVMK